MWRPRRAARKSILPMGCGRWWITSSLMPKSFVFSLNLNTHTPAALYEAFKPAEARRILRKFEFHYTPKHARWLNMVEIELAALISQCPKQCIPSQPLLRREVRHWEANRNASRDHLLAFTTDSSSRAFTHPNHCGGLASL